MVTLDEGPLFKMSIFSPSPPEMIKEKLHYDSSLSFQTLKEPEALNVPFNALPTLATLVLNLLVAQK